VYYHELSRDPKSKIVMLVAPILTSPSVIGDRSCDHCDVTGKRWPPTTKFG